MARIIPQERLERIAWFKARQTAWSTNATAIGTTSADVTEVGTLLAAAEAARAAQETAIATAQAKSAAFYAAVDALSLKGLNVVKQIRTKGEGANDPEIWELAMIPAPATPTPTGLPAAPEALKVSLDGDGAVNLSWRCKNPPRVTGVLYSVHRQLDGATGWENLGVTGVRKFVDVTIPVGTTKVTYKIRGVRSMGAGPWTQFVVQFGTNAVGVLTASLAPAATTTPAPAPKLAA